MKPFTRRIAICLALLLIAGWVVTRATLLYARGEGGFKLGVDLVGGTILVYEVDTERLEQERQADPNRKPFDPAEMAAFLKRRIDPADLYNVTIRPVGQTRFEIVLPTGGEHQARMEEQAWNDLLAKVRGNTAWAERLQLAGTLPDAPAGRTRDLVVSTNKLLQWGSVKQKLLDKYPALKAKQADLTKIEDGQTQALVDLVVAEAKVPADEVRKFIAENNPPPEDEVRSFVESNYAAAGKKNVSIEYVQQVKDLIAQQGSLEFRILANRHTDGAAFRVAEETIKKTDKLELERLGRAGLPPPPPAVDKEESAYTYSWVELGAEERQTLRLSNRFKDLDPRWNQARDARDKGAPYVLEMPDVSSTDNSKRGSTTMLIYSRKCENLRLTPAQRAERQFDYFVLLRNPVSPDKALTGNYLVNAGVNDLSLKPSVSFTFNARGGQLFYELTSNNLPQPPDQNVNVNFAFLAIILDGYVVSAPSLSVPISTQGEIVMSGARPEDLRRLAQILRSGALPATLKPQPVSESTIGPTLGADTIKRGTWSIAGAFAVVLLFMVVYYRFAGLVACIALLANLLLTVAFMVFVNATFTLPGLAGLVLMLGMAVDTNVLIYERLREERDRGASLLLALRNGYDRSFGTVIDTHLSVMFTAIVLYAVGNDQLKGFGISLCAGLAISLFTSLYMTRLIFDLGLAQGWVKSLSMFRFFSRTNIDFMRSRHFWFTTTVSLTVLGLALFLWRGPAGLNIDFVGGTAYGGQLTEPRTIGQLRALLDDDRQKELLAVKEVEQKDEAGYLFQITFNDGVTQTVQLANAAPGETKAAKEQAMRERAGELPDWSVEQTFVTTEPNIGGGSRYFTIRSTEKEAQLVQVAVSRLLREGDTPLLKKITIDDVQVQGKAATLTFSDPASPGYLKLLLDRAFRAAGVTEPQPFELRGIDKGVEGRFTKMAVEVSSQAVDSGKLTAILKQTQQDFASRPQPERLENFDAQLAADTSRRALYAILASWAALLLYIWFRFGNWTFGLAAVLCLIHDVVLTLGVIAACHYIYRYIPALADVLLLRDFKIDLPAVAALLTLVGYSINDKIVVYDRMREVRGKNVRLDAAMINASINQALSRTVLTGLSVFLVLFVLYVFGGEGVHLFAFVMVIGLAVGTYSSIYIASPLLLMFGEGQTFSPRERQAAAATTTA